MSRHVTPGELGLYLRVSIPTLLFGYFAEEALPARASLVDTGLEERSELRAASLVVAMMGIGIVAAIAVIWMPSMQWMLLSAVCCAPLIVQALCGTSRMRLRYDEKHLARFVSLVSGALIGLTSALALLGAGLDGPSTMVISGALATATAALAPQAYVWDQIRLRIPARHSENIKYGLQCCRNEGLIFARTMGDTYAVTVLLGATAGGIYSRAYSVPQTAAGTAFTTLRPVYAPIFARLDAEEQGRATHRVALLYTSSFAIAVSPLIVYPQEVVRVLFGPNWTAVGHLLPWVAVSVTSSLYLGLLQAGQQATGEFRSSFRTNQLLLFGAALSILVSWQAGDLLLIVKSSAILTGGVALLNLLKGVSVLDAVPSACLVGVAVYALHVSHGMPVIGLALYCLSLVGSLWVALRFKVGP